MSYQKDREEFIAIMAREVPSMSLDALRRMMKFAKRKQRLAEALCNGDYPCDNGQRETQECSHCGLGYASDSMDSRGVCPDCRNDERIIELAAKYGCKAVLSSGPRGAVVKLALPSGFTNDWGREGVCVPAR